MIAGLRVVNDDGVLQIDESFKCMSLLAKGGATCNVQNDSWGRIKQYDLTYSGNGAVLALHTPASSTNPNLKLMGVQGSHRNANGSLTTRIYIIWLSSTTPPAGTFDFEWYLFGAPVLQSSPVGLNVFSPVGELVYTSNAKLLKVARIGAGSGSGEEYFDASPARKIAIVGFTASVSVDEGVNNTTSGENIPYFTAYFSGFYCYDYGFRVRNGVAFDGSALGQAPMNPSNRAYGLDSAGLYGGRGFAVDVTGY